MLSLLQERLDLTAARALPPTKIACRWTVRAFRRLTISGVFPAFFAI
jgi:hypothetical protein